MEVDLELLSKVFLLVLIILLVFNLTKWSAARQSRFPGPQGLPFIGNALSVDFSKIHLSFGELAVHYGKVFQLTMLGKDIIVINDLKLARRLLQSDEYRDVFCDKPEYFAGKYIMFNCSDIGFGRWTKRTCILRRILHKGLKVFGDGVNRFENRMMDELDRLILDINKKEGMDFDISIALKQSFGNWMSSLITGENPEEGDSELIWKFLEAFSYLLNPGWNLILLTFPFLRNFPGKPGNLFRDSLRARDELLDRFCSSYSKADTVQEPHSLLAALRKLTEEENEKAGYDVIGSDDFKGLLLDIFVAGTETTMTALTNTFALLLKYPEHMKRLQTEIDSVIGRSRKPNLNDRSKMPFTKAFILESHRLTSEVPLSASHKPVTDVNFDGQLVSKNTHIILNLWFIHHDSNVWTNPWNFHPERFLDANGKLLPPEHELRQTLIPFSIGRRSCPGETLAMSRMFLYLTRILQVFDIKPPSSGKLPEINPKSYELEITLRIKEYLCRAIQRTRSN